LEIESDFSLDKIINEGKTRDKKIALIGKCLGPSSGFS